jgi:hypothetical protein
MMSDGNNSNNASTYSYVGISRTQTSETQEAPRNESFVTPVPVIATDRKFFSFDAMRVPELKYQAASAQPFEAPPAAPPHFARLNLDRFKAPDINLSFMAQPKKFMKLNDTAKHCCDGHNCPGDPHPEPADQSAAAAAETSAAAASQESDLRPGAMPFDPWTNGDPWQRPESISSASAAAPTPVPSESAFHKFMRQGAALLSTPGQPGYGPRREAADRDPRRKPDSSFVWFPQHVPASSLVEALDLYHASTRLEHCDGLLVDTGAYDNLTGSEWAGRVQATAARFGHGTEWTQMSTPLSIDGVGNGSSSCERAAKIPISLKCDDGTLLQSTFSAPVVEQSTGKQLPALLGIRSMKAQRVLLDCIHNKYIIVGQGGFQLQLSPGSKVLTMVESRSGHLLLPCTSWQTEQASRTAQSQKLVFNSAGDSVPMQYQ